MILLLLLSSPLLTHGSVSRACRRTEQAYPSDEHDNDYKVNARPTPTNSASTCSAPALTCCSPVTEYLMGERAQVEYPRLLLAVVRGRLDRVSSMIASASVLPSELGQEFVQAVWHGKEGNPPESLLGMFVDMDKCGSRSEVVGMKSKVQAFAEPLVELSRALKSGLKSIKVVLGELAMFEVGEECLVSAVKNGVYSGEAFSLAMCQICNFDSAQVSPCDATCKNVARGCLAPLTQISGYLAVLSQELDLLQELLLQNVYDEEGALDLIETEVKWTFVDDPDLARECSLARSPTPRTPGSSFTGSPLELVDVVGSSADYACILTGNSNTNCWTEEGIVDEDTSFLAPYTANGQTFNPLLPFSSSPWQISALNDAITRATTTARVYQRDTVWAFGSPTEKQRVTTVYMGITSDGYTRDPDEGSQGSGAGAGVGGLVLTVLTVCAHLAYNL